jgi:hypothetical protein
MAYFLLTRVALFAVTACAIRFVPGSLPADTLAALGQNRTIGALLRWDSWWYLSIVRDGYGFDPRAQSSVAFLPLFPLFIRGATVLTGNPVVAGLLVANVAALGAVAALWAWVRAEAGPEAAERTGRWLAVFPFSFFLHAVYAEGLFIVLVALSLWAARDQRWLAAGLLGGLAGATRPMGVLLGPAYAWGVGRAWQGGRPPRWADVLGLALVPAGLASYMGYLALRFGDPLAFWRTHEAGWGVRAGAGLETYGRTLRRLLTRGPGIGSYAEVNDLLRLVLLLAAVLLTVVVFRRLGAVPGIYAALSVAVAVLFASESLGRELLAAVPLFAAAGLADRGGSLGEAVRVLSFGLLTILLFAFATAHFVG